MTQQPAASSHSQVPSFSAILITVMALSIVVTVAAIIFHSQLAPIAAKQTEHCRTYYQFLQEEVGNNQTITECWSDDGNR
jgi:hypothetical protein